MRQDVLIHTLSGTSAGAFATVLLYPIDSIKTRMQAQDGTAARKINDVTMYRSTRHALRAVIQTEGFLALYQGMTPALVGGAVAWGLYFGGYNFVCCAVVFKSAAVLGFIALLMYQPYIPYRAQPNRRRQKAG